MYSVHCTAYTVQYTLYTVQCTLYNVQRTLYNIHCTLYSVRCTMYSVRCTLHNVQYKVYTAMYTNKKLFSNVFKCFSDRNYVKYWSEFPRWKYWKCWKYFRVLLLPLPIIFMIFNYMDKVGVHTSGNKIQHNFACKICKFQYGCF